MALIALALSAAAGLFIGWAAGSATAAYRSQRCRESEPMRRHAAMVRALKHTASPDIGEQ
jgi:hypothetical protein